MNELRKACCEDASSLHNSFCPPFLAELSTAICKLFSSTASGPNQIVYPLLKHLSEPAQLLHLPLSSPFTTWKTHFHSVFFPPHFSHLLHLQVFWALDSFSPNFSPWIKSSPLHLPGVAFVLVDRLSTKFFLCLNQSGTASKRKSLQTKPFWHLLTSPRLSTRFSTLLCITNCSRSSSPLVSFLGCALSFLMVELKSWLVVPVAVPSTSDEGSPRARYLVQSSSSCLLVTSPRIYLGVPMPPCMLTIWPSGPPPQTRSKPLLLSNPLSLS